MKLCFYSSESDHVVRYDTTDKLWTVVLPDVLFENETVLLTTNYSEMVSVHFHALWIEMRTQGFIVP